jgi:putative transposase
MYRINLTEEQHHALKQQTRQHEIAGSMRDRLEMVRLSDAGWSVPRIARHLDWHEQTVRTWIKAFLEGGWNALENKPRGGKSSALTPELVAAAREEIAKGQRVWSSGQIADWLAAQYQVRLSERRVREHLRRGGLSWQRTSRSLQHKQKPAAVEATAATLEMLQKGAMRD